MAASAPTVPTATGVTRPTGEASLRSPGVTMVQETTDRDDSDGSTSKLTEFLVRYGLAFMMAASYRSARASEFEFESESEPESPFPFGPTPAPVSPRSDPSNTVSVSTSAIARFVSGL